MVQWLVRITPQSMSAMKQTAIWVPGSNPTQSLGGPTITIWLVVEPTHLKNMNVKLDHFPNFRGANKKYLSCHHPAMVINHVSVDPSWEPIIQVTCSYKPWNDIPLNPGCLMTGSFWAIYYKSLP